MPYLNGKFVAPDAYPAVVSATPKVTDMEAISPELIGQIYAEGYTRGFTEGALSFLDERAKLDTEKILQQEFAAVPAN